MPLTMILLILFSDASEPVFADIDAIADRTSKPRVIPTLKISETESLNEMEFAFVLMKRLLKVSHAILFSIPKAIT